MKINHLTYMNFCIGIKIVNTSLKIFTSGNIDTIKNVEYPLIYFSRQYSFTHAPNCDNLITGFSQEKLSGALWKVGKMPGFPRLLKSKTRQCNADRCTKKWWGKTFTPDNSKINVWRDTIITRQKDLLIRHTEPYNKG